MIRNKINGKIYIGQTIRSVKIRLEEHQKGKRGCSAIYDAIKKYEWNNFEIDWYECPDEDLNFDEELLVREMGTLSPDGYNLMEGGGSGGKRSEESKQKMSGENHHMWGKTHNGETRRKIGDGNRGKTVSKETKQKMIKSRTGEKHHSSKRVYQYSLDGTFINSFGSSGEAGLHMKKDGSLIRRCALGVNGYKTAYKFKWSYTFPFM